MRRLWIVFFLSSLCFSTYCIGGGDSEPSAKEEEIKELVQVLGREFKNLALSVNPTKFSAPKLDQSMFPFGVFLFNKVKSFLIDRFVFHYKKNWRQVEVLRGELSIEIDEETCISKEVKMQAAFTIARASHLVFILNFLKNRYWAESIVDVLSYYAEGFEHTDLCASKSKYELLVLATGFFICMEYLYFLEKESVECTMQPKMQQYLRYVVNNVLTLLPAYPRKPGNNAGFVGLNDVPEECLVRYENTLRWVNQWLSSQPEEVTGYSGEIINGQHLSIKDVDESGHVYTKSSLPLTAGLKALGLSMADELEHWRQYIELEKNGSHWNSKYSALAKKQKKEEGLALKNRVFDEVEDLDESEGFE